MRAWTYTSRGDPTSVLKLITLPKPNVATLKKNEVLIKVLYVGMFTAYGDLMRRMPHPTSAPWIPEMEFSGIVDSIGAGVTKFKVGDEVFGGQDPITHFGSGGTMAEYVKFDQRLVVKKPEHLSFEIAATLVPIGCTAAQFAEKANLKAGMKVLVTAAASATGMAMVQMARSVLGESGIVVGTCSSSSAEMVRILGVDETIDYKTMGSLSKYLSEHHTEQPFDVIFDFAGGDPDLYDKSKSYLTERGIFLFGGNIRMTRDPNGSLFTIIAWVMSIALKTNWPSILGGTPRKGLFHSAWVDEKSLGKVKELADGGHLKTVVEEVYEMEDVVEAYRKLATVGAKGKLVVRVQ